MKRFIVQISLFAGILFLLDVCTSYVLQQFRPSDYKLFIDAKKEFFELDSVDILFIGDSHIADAIDTRIIEKNTGLIAFNMGIYHSTPFENYYTVLDAYSHLKNKPKVIVLGASPDMFTKPAIPGKYTPLLINNFRHRWALNWYSSQPLEAESFSMTLKEGYLFKSMTSKISGKKYVPTRKIKTTHHGYLESNNQIKGTKWTDLKEDPYRQQLDQQIQYLRKIITTCQSNGTKVIVMGLPIWSEKLNANRNTKSFIEFEATLKSICDEFSVPAYNLDFNILHEELDQSDFLNTDHLNYSGARKFSEVASSWIEEKK